MVEGEGVIMYLDKIVYFLLLFLSNDLASSGVYMFIILIINVVFVVLELFLSVCKYYESIGNSIEVFVVVLFNL